MYHAEVDLECKSTAKVNNWPAVMMAKKVEKKKEKRRPTLKGCKDQVLPLCQQHELLCLKGSGHFAIMIESRLDSMEFFVRKIIYNSVIPS